jgi:cytochrome c553
MTGCARLALAVVAAALGTTTALAAGDEYAPLRDRLETCFVCHGENGASKEPEFPIIAGQHLYYLYVQMKDFKAGRRRGERMEEVVRELSRDEMRALAKFFSEQSWPSTGYRGDPDLARDGSTAANAGQCFQCHRGGYEGDSRNPRLAGQHARYLEKTMRDFKSKTRNNSPAKSSLMGSYSAEDIAGLAEFLADM